MKVFAGSSECVIYYLVNMANETNESWQFGQIALSEQGVVELDFAEIKNGDHAYVTAYQAILFYFGCSTSRFKT